MFERYTEQARRVLFFARYETSQLGGRAIEPEHILLGLVRESKGLTHWIFAQADVSAAALRSEIEARAVFQEKIAPSVEIPFSRAAQHVLTSTAAEASALGHNYIGTEHLLLGLLREERSFPAELLVRHGLTADGVREQITQVAGGREGLARSSLQICCFCGERLIDAVVLTVSGAGGHANAQQHLYSHRQCLRERVAPDIPLLFDRDDDT